MNLHWKKCCAALTAGAMLCAIALAAAQEENSIRPVGDRMTAQNERLQSREDRALFSKAYPDALSDEQELTFFEEAQQLSSEELLSKVEEKSSVEEKAGIEEKSSLSNTSHLGAYHQPHYITPLGDVIRLEDGSEWAVRYSDRNNTLDWYTSDRLIITPNHDWFSSYDYRINNESTGAVVRVNLITAPYYNGVFTHWIVAIDYTHKQVCLEDGSVWSISVWDGAELSRMALEDTIIIGTNDSWFKSSRPNILINVDTLEFVKARCDF